MSNRLPVLAAKVKSLHQESARLIEAGLARAIEAGECLLEAKQHLKHGAWLPWLKEDCGISPRTAQLYMRLAKHKVEIQKRNVAHLSMVAVVRLLEKPKQQLGPLGPMPGAPHRIMLAPSNWPSDISEHYRLVAELTEGGVGEPYWRQLCDLRIVERSESDLLKAFEMLPQRIAQQIKDAERADAEKARKAWKDAVERDNLEKRKAWAAECRVRAEKAAAKAAEADAALIKAAKRRESAGAAA